MRARAQQVSTWCNEKGLGRQGRVSAEARVRSGSLREAAALDDADAKEKCDRMVRTCVSCLSASHQQNNYVPKYPFDALSAPFENQIIVEKCGEEL